METVMTTILLVWAIAGLFIPFLVLQHYRPAWDLTKRLLTSLGIYLGGGAVLLYLHYTLYG